jgi:hypothetical protein
VSLADLIILKRNFGITTGATRAQGDLTADGRVDRGDLIAFVHELGRTSAAGSPAAVVGPEPAVVAGGNRPRTATLAARRAAVDVVIGDDDLGSQHELRTSRLRATRRAAVRSSG